jgi:predicted permease
MSIWRDLRYAARSLKRAPGFTVVAVVVLAVGIGANSAMFSLVDAALLRPLPFAQPDRLVMLWERSPRFPHNRVSPLNFLDWSEQQQAFASVAAIAGGGRTLTSGGGEVERIPGQAVTWQFFETLGIRPVAGVTFTAEDTARRRMVVVISERMWKNRFGNDPSIVGRTLTLDGEPYTIIGIVPASFQILFPADMWTLFSVRRSPEQRRQHYMQVVGRLKPGATLDQARTDMAGVADRIAVIAPETNKGWGVTIEPLRDAIVGQELRTTSLVLAGVVTFVLLMACANVANLLLAQASVRARELAVRSALGASRGRLIRQFLTEAFLLSLAGGGLGVLGALAGVAALVRLAPDNLPRLDSVSVSMPVLVFALLLATAVAAGLGAFTALRATSADPREGLVEGGRGQAGSQGSQRLGRVIVAAQIAITLVLVVGAGLFGRSLMKVLDVNPGFRVDRVVTMDVALPWQMDPKAKAGQAIFYSSLIDRLKQIPGVHKVGATSGLPIDGGLPDGGFLLMTQNEVPKTMEGLIAQFKQKERFGVADFCVATDGYFQALAIPLIRGRIFDERDSANTPHVAVISESLARDRWPGQDPIGHTIEFGNMDGDMRLLTIVGIVGDVGYYGLDVPSRPTVYVDLFQRPRSSMSVTMLSDADTQLVTTAARGILQDLNPEIPARFRTLSQIYSASLGSRRFNVILIGFFGITALLLATAGVFGVMAYSVSRRTREIGVRVALGAASGDALRMILGQGLRTILIGVAIGVTGALALTRTVASLLYGVTATDPLTFVGVTLLLVGAALLACYIPARRATKVDPMVALRSE